VQFEVGEAFQNCGKRHFKNRAKTPDGADKHHWMKWHWSLLLLLGAGNIPDSSSSTTGVTTTPPYIDAWCEEWCSSWDDCNEIFGSNYVDLRLRVRFTLDDGPGRHLMHHKYFGNTISRQSFETQFVLDVSSALETSPCRLHITSVSAEGGEKYWDSEIDISGQPIPT
jgi:hypothetical protein